MTPATKIPFDFKGLLNSLFDTNGDVIDLDFETKPKPSAINLGISEDIPQVNMHKPFVHFKVKWLPIWLYVELN